MGVLARQPRLVKRRLRGRGQDRLPLVPLELCGPLNQAHGSGPCLRADAGHRVCVSRAASHRPLASDWNRPAWRRLLVFALTRSAFEPVAWPLLPWLQTKPASDAGRLVVLPADRGAWRIFVDPQSSA